MFLPSRIISIILTENHNPAQTRPQKAETAFSGALNFLVHGSIVTESETDGLEVQRKFIIQNTGLMKISEYKIWK